MKRKQVGELRASPIAMQVSRHHVKSPMFGVHKIQPFFPPIESLFKTEVLDHPLDYGIKFPDPIASITDSTLRTASGKIVEVHPKITMLLSPFKWMRGEHASLDLPTITEKASSTHQKLQSPNTAGYVGSILSVALSLSGCDHFPKVYGAYTGICQKHTIDISDDYEELCERAWFSSNIGKTFELKLEESTGEHIQYTRTARVPVLLGEEIDLGEIQELETVCTTAVAADLTKVFSDDEEDEDESSSNMSTDYIFEIESVGSFEEYEEGDDEPFAWATFTDVPVQLTIMEKLDGTMYDLFTTENSEKHFAWLGQIVFALAFAQRTIGLTHNDLHGNNIMYTKTTEEFLYYSHDGHFYALPTYGYILKIIDFDRGIGSVRVQGMKEPKLFMSDQFHQNEEAGGQYNAEPFYNSHYPMIKPNPSFDLVRLATSIFWDLFPEGPNFEYSSPVFKLFMKWLTLPDGSSVLFHKENPKIDRYYGFNLYKAIARYCKDVVPRKEIYEFTCFLCELPLGVKTLII